MNYDSYNSAIKRLVEEINALRTLDLELDPFWKPYPILDPRNASLGYKLHRRNGQDNRVLNLVVDSRAFVRLRDDSMTLKSETKGEIVKAVEAFWNAGNPEIEQCITVR
jgi:hypothetical protein